MNKGSTNIFPPSSYHNFCSGPFLTDCGSSCCMKGRTSISLCRHLETHSFEFHWHQLAIVVSRTIHFKLILGGAWLDIMWETIPIERAGCWHTKRERSEDGPLWSTEHPVGLPQPCGLNRHQELLLLQLLNRKEEGWGCLSATFSTK